MKQIIEKSVMEDRMFISDYMITLDDKINKKIKNKQTNKQTIKQTNKQINKQKQNKTKQKQNIHWIGCIVNFVVRVCILVLEHLAVVLLRV